MREASTISQVEHRLVELSCPPALLQCKMRELAEHREDLRQEALEEGLSQSQAEARADELMGEPYGIAEHLAAALRQSSWWGRHPVLGFCVLPPLAILSAVMLLFTLVFWSAPVVFPLDLASELANDASGVVFILNFWQAIYCLTVLVVAAVFVRLSRRAIAGIKWAVMACVMCALHGWMIATPDQAAFADHWLLAQAAVGGHRDAFGRGDVDWLAAMANERGMENAKRGMEGSETKISREHEGPQTAGREIKTPESRFHTHHRHRIHGFYCTRLICEFGLGGLFEHANKTETTAPKSLACRACRRLENDCCAAVP